MFFDAQSYSDTIRQCKKGTKPAIFGKRPDFANAPTRSSKIASIESRLFFMPYTRRVPSAGDVSGEADADESAANAADDEDEEDEESTDSGVDLIADLTADFAADLAADLVPMKPPVAAGV